MMTDDDIDRAIKYRMGERSATELAGEHRRREKTWELQFIAYLDEQAREHNELVEGYA